MYIYRVDPIDWWIGWSKVSDVFRVEACREFDQTFWDASAWYAAWKLAQEGARQIWWEGDCRSGPYVIPLPEMEDAGWRFIIGWKQDNNGTSFIASPEPLPHLRNGDNWVHIGVAKAA